MCFGTSGVQTLFKHILANGPKLASPAGPPNHNLAMYAARSMMRHPEDAQTWVLTFRDGSTNIFVDPNDTVATLKDWLNTGVCSGFHVPENWGEKPLEPTRRGPAPLVVRGLVKVRHLECTDMHCQLNCDPRNVGE